VYIERVQYCVDNALNAILGFFIFVSLLTDDTEDNNNIFFNLIAPSLRFYFNGKKLEWQYPYIILYQRANRYGQ